MIKLGTQVQHKLHDDLNGDVVQLNRKSNTATVKFWNYQDEMMLVSVYLSDLEPVNEIDSFIDLTSDALKVLKEVA